jgi:virginiamycin B lyase
VGCAGRALPYPDDSPPRPHGDLAASPDLSRVDASGASDLSPRDLGVSGDLALGDLAAPPDLSARDLALSPVLTSVDLTIPLLSEFTIPTAQSEAIAIAPGADGNLWFAEYGASKIGRITLEGVITEFALAHGSWPEGVVAGADGNIWFPESARSRVGRITPSGDITEFLLNDAAPSAICAGPDGNLWVTDQKHGQVIRITTAGAVTGFALGGVSLLSIAAGPDGRLWIVDYYGSLQSMNVDGTPGPSYPLSYASGSVAAGPDALWITSGNDRSLLRITPAGMSRGFFIPGYSEPVRAAVAPDQVVWFTGQDQAPGGGGDIGRLATDGTITFSPLKAYSMPVAITIGPDGNVWFTEYNPGAIGRLRRN